MVRLRSHTLAFMLAVLASPAFAESEKSSMPQMNPEWYANQLFWLAVSFVVLYLIVSCVIVPKLNRVLGGRKQTIEGTIAEAESLKNQAESARNHYESVEAKARKDASSMVAEVTASTNRAIAETQAKMDADLKKRIAASDAAINEKLAAARAGVSAAAASLVVDIYSSVMGKSIDAKKLETSLNKQ